MRSDRPTPKCEERSTLELWQRRASRELTGEDAREIAENVAGFFRLLLEWKSAADSAAGTRPDESEKCPSMIPESAQTDT